MGVAATCAKYALLILNLLFFLLSLPLLGIGIWLKVDTSRFHKLLSMVKTDGLVHSINNTSTSWVSVLAMILIIIGTIMLFVSFCGLLGAIKENKIILYIYMFLTTCIIGAQASIITVVAVKKDKIHAILAKQFRSVLKREYQNLGSTNSTWFSYVLNAFMIKHKCCGINGVTDFQSFNNWKKTAYSGEEVPIACCHFKANFQLSFNTTFDQIRENMLDETCETSTTSKNIYREGCIHKMWNLIARETMITSSVLIAILVLEVVCVIFACCIIQKSYNKMK